MGNTLARCGFESGCITSFFRNWPPDFLTKQGLEATVLQGMRAPTRQRRLVLQFVGDSTDRCATSSPCSAWS